MVPENDAHTGRGVGPGNLAVPEHPRQSSQGIGAEAGACKARARQMEFVTKTAVTQKASQVAAWRTCLQLG